MAPENELGPELPITESALDEDLRRTLAHVDPADPDAGVRAWRAFLEHAGRPLAYGDRYDPHPSNDLVIFNVSTAENVMHVEMQRRVGVVKDHDYEGTIVATCRMSVAVGERAASSASLNVEGFGRTSGGLAAFRDQVEGTEAFAALSGNRVLALQALAYYG